jgi:hypothetical protein
VSDWIRFWEYSSADWTGLQFVVLVIAAVLGFRQVREARQLREAQAEPFVVVDFDVAPGSQQIYLVISNIGKTAARDVRLRFDPELTSSFDDDPGIVAPRDLKPFREGIPSLPPRKRLPLMLDIFPKRKPDEMPDVYRVHVEFYAPALKKRLEDDSVIDLGIYRNALHPVRRDTHDIHERLKELVTETRKWTAFGNGVLTLSPRQARARTADVMDYHRLDEPLPKRWFYWLRIRLRRLFR